MEEQPDFGEWGVLKVSAVTSGTFKPRAAKRLPSQLRPIPELEVRQGDILVARANGVAELVGVAVEVRGAPPRLMLSDKTLRVVPRLSALDGSFLALLLQSDRVRRQVMQIVSGSSGQKNISQNQIRRLDVAIPPVEEQRRIAEILDSVDELIRSTERLIAKTLRLETALASALIEHTSSMWQSCQLGDLLLGIEAGRSPEVPDRPAKYDEWGVLKVSAIRSRGFEEGENKVVTQRRFINDGIEVHAGDLLISRANTPELVGLACYIHRVRPRLMLSDKTLRLVADSHKASGQYLARALATPLLRRQIENSGTGSSGSMKNISQKEIRHLVVHLPPLNKQHEIVMRLQSVTKKVECEQRRLAKLQTLRSGLIDDLLIGRVRVLAKGM
ncbi:restriction endonuclease subunit S [Micromonospora taraxaci]|uniref:restriction endonuclease subunit S n=1 Tax=Micromonospora taraxaci TaxID=1316803 RepID=UPI0033F58990